MFFYPGICLFHLRSKQNGDIPLVYRPSPPPPHTQGKKVRQYTLSTSVAPLVILNKTSWAIFRTYWSEKSNNLKNQLKTIVVINIGTPSHLSNCQGQFCRKTPAPLYNVDFPIHNQFTSNITLFKGGGGDAWSPVKAWLS